jgi:O-antigen/teichoic acid export membrane protein
MLLVVQGDRLAVGVRYSVVELAGYAAAASCAMLPAATLMRITGPLILSHLSSAQLDRPVFVRRLSRAAEILSFFGGLYGIAAILAGGPLLALIFGSTYANLGPIIAWFGLAQTLRLLRALPTVAAMSVGDTHNSLRSNVFRLSGVGLAFLFAYRGASIGAIASTAAVGEIISLAEATRRMSITHQVPLATYLSSWLPTLSLIAVSVALAQTSLAASLRLTAAAALLFCLIAMHVVIFGESRRVIVGSLRSVFTS